MEYNGKFPPNCNWKMAYNRFHLWDGSDWQGASLKALEILGKKKGYQLVGTNLRGTNAFFVRCDLAADHFILPATAENLYNPVRAHITYRDIFKRTDTTYKTRHAAKYCLVDQLPEIGELNYMPDKFVLPTQGFSIIQKNNCDYASMTENIAYIAINNENRYKKIILPVILEDNLINKGFAKKINIYVDDELRKQFILDKNITVDIDISNTKNPYIHIKLEFENLSGFQIFEKSKDMPQSEEYGELKDSEQIRRTRMADEEKTDLGIYINMDKIMLSFDR